MPIYEYKCNLCGTIFSLLKSMNSTEKAKCSKCGSDDTKKMISTFACSADTNSRDSYEGGCSNGCCSCNLNE